MKIHEDRSHMNIDTRWFEKGYAKEDVHSLRLQSLCTEAEAAANKQFYDSHTREEWEQYIRQASLESSAAMKPVMEAIAQDFVCYQYDENIPVSYGHDKRMNDYPLSILFLLFFKLLKVLPDIESGAN